MKEMNYTYILNNQGGVWSINSCHVLEKVTEVLVRIQASTSTSSTALSNTDADNFLKLIFSAVSSHI